MYLFFDTETTGLPKDWKAPITDFNNWPRLVQLAYLKYSDNGTLLAEGDYIIKPDGFIIPQEASKIHRITNEKAIKHGLSLEFVLAEFAFFVSKSNVLVAHNMSFDEKILGSEYLRLGLKNPLVEKKRLCTMKLTTDLCKIPGQYGFKYPNLNELHNFLFNTNFEEAHNAAADIHATAKCFWELKRLNKI